MYRLVRGARLVVLLLVSLSLVAHAQEEGPNATPRSTVRAFLDAARAAAVEITALALPQCCFSEAVAAIVREGGATQVAVARAPDEDAMFEVLERALQARSGLKPQT